MFFDTHCHLDFDVFKKSLPDDIESWRSLGVQRFLLPATEPSRWEDILKLCKLLGLQSAIGIHPYFLTQIEDQGITLQEVILNLENFVTINDSDITAIGECGMDGRRHLQHQWQEKLLEAHLELAIKVNKPIVIHSVQTHHKIVELIKRKKNQSLKGVIHGFSGSYEQAKQFIDLGLLIGVGGVITRTTAHKTRDAIQRIPIEAIVLETDSPDMRLQDSDDAFNSPKNILPIFSKLTQIRAENPSILAEQIYKNSVQLFG